MKITVIQRSIDYSVNKPVERTGSQFFIGFNSDKEIKMADGQVTCINNPDVNSSHEHITHLGNPANQWRWTYAHVIDSAGAGTNTLYVIDPLGGARADIGVVREFGRAPYLRTYADREWNNKLLSLNQCPI